LKRGSLASDFLNRGDDFVRARLIRAEAQSNVRAFRRQAFDNRAADTLIASGNRCDFAVQSVSHFSAPVGSPDVMQVAEIVTPPVSNEGFGRWRQRKHQTLAPDAAPGVSALSVAARTASIFNPLFISNRCLRSRLFTNSRVAFPIAPAILDASISIVRPADPPLRSS
jgi:hypothetical protein